ncbi:MAG: hypothetical protein GX962_02950 [Epulopiscium sp.]|nr:hypothetical protein [Candidatus Epulonipiscium sp.]
MYQMEYIISTRKEDNGWYVEVETEIVGQGNSITVKHTVYDRDNTIVMGQNTTVATVETHTDNQILYVENPNLWGIESPNLYVLKTELLIDNIVIDEEVQNFGFRKIEYHTDNGFILNGRRVKINGVCEHHDLGALGAAMNKTALRRRLNIW